MTEYRTAFRETAILPDQTGRYRTCVLLASFDREWSESAQAAQVATAVRPTKALRLTLEQFDAFVANDALRFGYVDAPGDVESDFVPFDWRI